VEEAEVLFGFAFEGIVEGTSGLQQGEGSVDVGAEESFRPSD
jgi:hypothetical protein